jgi:hypothetical protein
MLSKDCLGLIFEYSGVKPFILFSSTCKYYHELWKKRGMKFIVSYTETHSRSLQMDLLSTNYYDNKIVNICDSFLNAYKEFGYLRDDRYIEKPEHIIHLSLTQYFDNSEDLHEITIYTIQYYLPKYK